MRFNLEIGAGDYRLADVDLFGRLATVTLWMGVPAQAVESRYNPNSRLRIQLMQRRSEAMMQSG
jgi:hypothetical protein